MGKMVTVEITSAGEHFQMARVLKDSEIRSPGLVEPLPKGVVSGVQSETMHTIDNARRGSRLRWWMNLTVLVLLVAVFLDILRLLYLWHAGGRTISQ